MTADHLQAVLSIAFAADDLLYAVYVREHALPPGQLTPAGYTHDHAIRVEVRQRVPVLFREWRFPPEADRHDVVEWVARAITDLREEGFEEFRRKE